MAIPPEWTPRLATDLAELVAAAAELAQLIGTPAIVEDFTAELTRVADRGSAR